MCLVGCASVQAVNGVLCVSTLCMVQVIPASWLRLFDPREVNQLVGGGASGDIDVNDLQQHSAYSNGYSSSDHTICLFWKVIPITHGKQSHSTVGRLDSSSAARQEASTSCPSRAPNRVLMSLAVIDTLKRDAIDASPSPCLFLQTLHCC